MPARPKTSTAALVEAAILLIDERGLDALSLNDLAASVGIRAPSLYKHFEDRAALLRAAETKLLDELYRRLLVATQDPADPLLEMAVAYRTFAKAHPHAYSLVFASQMRGPEGTLLRQQVARPMLEMFAAWTGSPTRALIAARAFTAFCHGFVTMELAGEFRFGGDVGEAFVEGVRMLQVGIRAGAGGTKAAGA